MLALGDDDLFSVIVTKITNSGGGSEQVYRSRCPVCIGTQLTQSFRAARCHEDP